MLLLHNLPNPLYLPPRRTIVPLMAFLLLWISISNIMIGQAGLAGLAFSICSLFSPNQSTTPAFVVSNKSSTFIHEFLFLFGFAYPSCEYVTVHYFHGKLPFDCLMNLLLLSTCNSPFLQTQSSCWKEKLQIMLWYVCKYFEWQTMTYAKTQLDRIPVQSA